jgi:acetyl esterase/lipase
MGMGTRSIHARNRHEAHRCRRYLQACRLILKFSRMLMTEICSGGNLAAVLTHKAAQLYPPIPLIFQLLIVPVTDNTASASGIPHASWRENKHAPWLTPARMLWFRRQYLPHEQTRARWDASPLLAQDEMFSKVPKAWIAVAELDILRDEGIAYGNKLLTAGVPAKINTYKGAPHPIMAMDGTYRLTHMMIILVYSIYSPFCVQGKQMRFMW